MVVNGLSVGVLSEGISEMVGLRPANLTESEFVKLPVTSFEPFFSNSQGGDGYGTGSGSDLPLDRAALAVCC